MTGNNAREYLTLEEGVYLVKLARKTVLNKLKGLGFPEVEKSTLSSKLREKRGVFTTLYKIGGIRGKKELRGCIGYPIAIKPLYIATMETAIEAAFNDPRFLPLKKDEIDNIIFEVSVLTPLKKIEYKSPLELTKLIKIGRDGLVLKYGLYSGLLLPQVPVEYNWSPEDFLINLSMKAGLPPDGYLYKGVEIYRFSAQIFVEEKPYGSVVEEDITKHKVT